MVFRYFCVKLFVQEYVSTFRAGIREAAGGKAPAKSNPRFVLGSHCDLKDSVNEVSLQETQLSSKQGEGEMEVT